MAPPSTTPMPTASTAAAAAAGAMGLGTNVYELCVLRSVTWRVYRRRRRAPLPKTPMDDAWKHEPPEEREVTTPMADLAALYHEIQSRPLALYAWETTSEEATEKEEEEEQKTEEEEEEGRTVEEEEGGRRTAENRMEEGPELEEDEDEASADPRLWVFVVNDAQSLPAAKFTDAVDECARGHWTRDAASSSALSSSVSLPRVVRRWLFAALHVLATKQLTTRGGFIPEAPPHDRGTTTATTPTTTTTLPTGHGPWFWPQDARFVYRSPSLQRVNQFEVVLDEALPMPALRLRFGLVGHCLGVNVEMALRADGPDRTTPPDDAHTATTTTTTTPFKSELGRPTSSWLRLLGLPGARDFTMLDVWHQEDALAARVIAETTYGDVLPRFRTLGRRKLMKKKRRQGPEGPDGNNGSSGTGLVDDAAAKSAEEREHDPEDDDDDDENAGPEGPPHEPTATRRGGNGAKRKRKRRPMPEASENDESIVPVSPDTHVNSPEAPGPVVRIAFPHDRPVLLHADPEVNIYRRRRRRRKRSKRSSGSNHNNHHRYLRNVTITFGQSTGATTVAAAAAAGGSTTTTATTITSGASTITGGSSLSLATRHGGAFASAGGMTASPLLPRTLVRTRSGSRRGSGGPTGAFAGSSASSNAKTESKPSLSLASSLVASLTQDEQQEALDAKPIKSHPLLEALDAYVDREMALPPPPRAHKRIITAPNDPSFSPCEDKRAVRNFSAVESLRSAMQADRFQSWLVNYYPRDYRKSKRQQEKELERKVLLNFDRSKLENYQPSASGQVTTTNVPSPQTIERRELEISLGIRLAVSDLLVTWDQGVHQGRRWFPFSQGTVRSADEMEVRRLAARVQPYLAQLNGTLQGRLGAISDDESGEVRNPWMRFEEVMRGIEGKHLTDEVPARINAFTDLPKICVASVESTFHADLPAVSEFALRGLHPVAAAKPIDYAIICPHTPSEWLGTLTLSVLSGLRCAYSQCSMGDQAPVDLSQVRGNVDVSVDSSSGMLLVECATKSSDAFGPYRAAGSLLRTVLAQTSKKKQAFSRTAVANVIYVVAPFRRGDMRHRMWLLGAVGSGLFGDDPEAMGSSSNVTMELLYLEDMYAVGVDADPFVLPAMAFALYNRIFESVNLKALDEASAPSTGKTRYVCERLYHLARPKEPKAPESIHVGYTISADSEWLIVCATDAVGSIVETKAIHLAGRDQSSAFVELLTFSLDFAALFGAKVVLTISRLDPSTCSDAVEFNTWSSLLQEPTFLELTTRYRAILTRLDIAQVSIVTPDRVQVRAPKKAVSVVQEGIGYLLVTPDDPKELRERSRTSNARWIRVSLAASKNPPQELTVVRVETKLSFAPPSSDAASSDAFGMEELLADFWRLSYLTLHPVTLERQSPLPAHLAALDRFAVELTVLKTQTSTDSLVFHR